MSRLVFVLLLSTAVSAMYTDIAQKMNERVVELFNAEKFSDLVKELFHEDAIFTSTSTNTPAKGHAAIEAHLKGSFTKYGELSGLKVVSATEEGAAVTLNQGTNVKLNIAEKIVDAKFAEIFVQFIQE